MRDRPCLRRVSPRSDSWLLAGCCGASAPRGGAVLDVFTGSGVLALAAARAGGRGHGGRHLAPRGAQRAPERAPERRAGAALRGDLLAPVAGERFD